MYIRILCPVYDNEKENCRILTKKEIYASVKKPSMIDTIRLNRYIGLGMYREWKKIGFPKGYYIWIWEQQDWEVDQEIEARWGEKGWKNSWWRNVAGKSM